MKKTVAAVVCSLHNANVHPTAGCSLWITLGFGPDTLAGSDKLAFSEEVMSLIARYRSGECLEVCEELTQAQQSDDEAKLVANEIMLRVRKNLLTLAQRWRDLGFVLESPLGTSIDDNVLRDLEEVAGALPVTLRAFYEQIGWISFIEEPPGSAWPDTEELDPIAVDELTDTQVDEISEAIADEDDDVSLVLFDDHLHKFNIAGVGPIYVPLPMEGGFDPALYFEGDPLQRADGSEYCFVQYLRETILERGGMGPAGLPTDSIDADLLKQLTTDLQPF